LTYPLERDGFKVVHARDGEEALARFAEEDVDLVVLDLMLPKLDGLEVCKRLRAGSAVPIIMLTARDDELDKVLGLELGADDYITKPFSIREFRSRVRALLRRAAIPSAAQDEEEIIERDGLRIDLGRRDDLAVADIEAVREHQRLACRQVGTDGLFVERRLNRVRHQHHDDVGPRARGRRLVDGKTVRLCFRTRFARCVKPDADVYTTVAQVQRMRVPLRTVAEDGHLASANEREVGVGVVIDFHVGFPASV